MILKRLQLWNFRNSSEVTVWDFSPRLTVVYGNNAKGKTNLLEAVYTSIYGQGFRESKEDQLICWGASEARIDAEFEKEQHRLQFKIHFHSHEGRVEKKYYVQSVKKTHRQYIAEQAQAVLFSPEQIEIINGSPDIRRSYFNILLSQFDMGYKKKLWEYESALRKRNKVLEHSTNDRDLVDELSFWDAYLLDRAAYITRSREHYCAFLNTYPNLEDFVFRVVYRKNEMTRERLSAYFEKQKYARKTLIGPQKDDFEVYMTNEGKEKQIHMYGSRSEQRMGVLWLKMGEIQYAQLEKKIKPILLLDDVFSEFDETNKRRIIHLIAQYQTVLTTTDSEYFIGRKEEEESVYIHLP